MTYKFLDPETWLQTINQWVIDGSKLESFGDSREAEWVVLRGRDGTREELYHFYDKETFESHNEMEPWGYDPSPHTAYISVEITLDPVPGAFHTIESAVSIIQNILNETISDYHPKVSQTV